MQRHRPVEGGAVLQVGTLRGFGGADVLGVLGGGQVTGGAGRLGAIGHLGGAFAQAVEVEHQELPGQARVAVPGERIEVPGHVIGVPDAVVVVRRRAHPAPAVALHDRRGGAVGHLGVAHAEIQRGVVGEPERTAALVLLHLGLVVAVLEHRAGHHRIGGLQAARRQCDVDDRQVAAVVHGGLAAHEGGHAEHAGRTIGTVRLRFGGGIVDVEGQVERVVDLPGDIEAERIHGVPGGQLHAAHRHVRVGHVLAVDDRRRHRAIGPGAVAGAVVEPYRQLAALLLHLVLHVGVIQRGGDVVGRLPLQGGLRIGALALHAVDVVGGVLRAGVDVGGTGPVLDAVGVALARLRQGAPVTAFIALEGGPALGHGGLVETGVALLVAGAQGHAEAVIGVALAEDARQLAGHVGALQRARQIVVGTVVDRLQAQADHRFGFERAQRPDVDGGADAAGGIVGAGGLVHLHRRDRLGGDVGKVERARAGQAATAVAEVGGGHLAAIEQHQVEVRADAAHGHLGAFAAGGAVDRHAADALQRFGQVGIGELADVLGDDAIDHALAVALEVHRRCQAAADTGDLHRIERGGIGALRRGCGGRILRPGRAGQHSEQRGSEHRLAGYDLVRLHWKLPPQGFR
ncbi:hypothetical protein D3C71_709810 [compost metagenome]